MRHGSIPRFWRFHYNFEFILCHVDIYIRITPQRKPTLIGILEFWNSPINASNQHLAMIGICESSEFKIIGIIRILELLIFVEFEIARTAMELARPVCEWRMNIKYTLTLNNPYRFGFLYKTFLTMRKKVDWVIKHQKNFKW